MVEKEVSMSAFGDLRIVSWNINGIRSFKNFKETLDSLEANIICLQETKVTRDMIDEPTALVEGYNAYFSFSRVKSGYSGVVTFCRDNATPSKAEEGLSGTLLTTLQADNVGCFDEIENEFSPQELKRLDSEGRTVITQHKFKEVDGSQGVLTLFNVYCPRADPEKPDRLDFKLRFYKLLQLRARAVKQSGSLVMIVGDVNTSHKQIDRCENVDQDEFEASPSRQWLNSFLLETTGSLADFSLNEEMEEFKMIDSYRYFHPHVKDAFTCWNTKANARATNYGSRIDYILVDRTLIQKMVESLILSEVYGSDHCPVMGILNIISVKAEKYPSACIKNFPEFSGVQQKLSSFFVKKSKVSDSIQDCSKDGHVDLSPKSMKRKHSGETSNSGEYSTESSVKKAKTHNGCSQKRILNFFQKSSVEKKQVGSDSSSTSSSQESVINSSGGSGIAEKDVFDVVKVEKSVSASSAWRNMLSGPRPPPLCKGHKEPCVERTVKKKGPNFNRKFFACARGEGSKTDPRARCDHFEWAQKK